MSKIKYTVYEVNSFELLQSKLEDLENESFLVELTPISNSKGEITKYVIFGKKSVTNKISFKKEFENNKSSKLLKFYGQS